MRNYAIVYYIDINRSVIHKKYIKTVKNASTYIIKLTWKAQSVLARFWNIDSLHWIDAPLYYITEHPSRRSPLSPRNFGNLFERVASFFPHRPLIPAFDPAFFEGRASEERIPPLLVQTRLKKPQYRPSDRNSWKLKARRRPEAIVLSACIVRRLCIWSKEQRDGSFNVVAYDLRPLADVWCVKKGFVTVLWCWSWSYRTPMCLNYAVARPRSFVLLAGHFHNRGWSYFIFVLNNICCSRDSVCGGFCRLGDSQLIILVFNFYKKSSKWSDPRKSPSGCLFRLFVCLELLCFSVRKVCLCDRIFIANKWHSFELNNVLKFSWIILFQS